MAEYHLEFLPDAIEDLDRIADYYIQTVGAASAERITDQILDALDRLEQFPYLGSLHPDQVLAAMEYRRIVTGNYVCVYRVIDHKIVVYRIVNGATDYPRFLYYSKDGVCRIPHSRCSISRGTVLCLGSDAEPSPGFCRFYLAFL